MFTDLLNAEITEDDGTVRRLTDMELTEFGLMLFVAGSETVARHLGWVADDLEAHPDQRAALVADPSLIPNAIEEVLRYEAPSPVNGRWTTHDVTVHDVTIPGGLPSSSSPARPGGTSASTPTPTPSTSTARSICTSPSATGSTSASVPPSPAWRAASAWRRR